MIEIILTGAPMGKERVRTTQQGHVYTPERTVNYEGRLALAAQTVMRGRPLLEGALRVDIVALMPIAAGKPKKWKADALAGVIRPTKKPDYDNYAKILDALNLVVWVDDAQIVKGDIEKHYSDRPMMAIRVTPIVGPSSIPEWVRRHMTEGDIFG